MIVGRWPKADWYKTDETTRRNLQGGWNLLGNLVDVRWGPVGGWNIGECLIKQADIKAAVFSVGKERDLGICLDLMVPFCICRMESGWLNKATVMSYASGPRYVTSVYVTLYYRAATQLCLSRASHE